MLEKSISQVKKAPKLKKECRYFAIREAISNGARSYKDISEIIGLSPITIRVYMSEAQISFDLNRKGQILSDESKSLPAINGKHGARDYRIQRIRKAIEKGFDIKRIAEYAGLSVQTVKTYAQEEGIKLPFIVPRSCVKKKSKDSIDVSDKHEKKEDFSEFGFDFGEHIVPLRGKILIEEYGKELLRKYSGKTKLQILARKYLRDDYRISPYIACRAVVYALERLIIKDDFVRAKLKTDKESLESLEGIK